MNRPRTAASIRRSYTGARSRAEGAGFESIIDNACAYYRSIGLADIEKTPEPMRPIGSPDRAGRFLACYTKQAQPDYKGILKGGRAINFEAKHTDSDRLTFDRVLTAQALRLSRTEALGGIAFVLCSFSGRYFYRVPWAVWRDMKSLFGRKYITPADLAEYRVQFAAPGVLLFLEGVKEKKDDLHMCT
jgi:recombination protein U|nr:MAG TPA: recombination protein [Caudoviricetes sp.]